MYMRFIENYFHPTDEEITILKQQDTIKMYNYVQDHGGFVKVSFELFQYYSQQYNKFLDSENFGLLQVFQKYLLNFELKTKTIDGSYLQRAKYLEDHINCFINPPEVWLTEQISVWSIPNQVLQELNRNLFTLDDIAKNHGTQFVDIRIQNPQTNQLDVVKENYYQAYSLKLKDFVKYTKNQSVFINSYPEYPQDKVLQAVNVDMGEWKQELKRFFEYLPQTLFKNSGLKYLRQNCPGTNIPEIYIRVDGSWIGGQQECQALNLININHGPGECVWLTIDAEYVHLLEDVIPDLYKNEGLWYVDIEFFLKHKIPIKQTIQKCGDIIFLGAGCFYLIKNIGTTLNTSLNFLMCNEYSFKQIQRRQQMNDINNIGCVVPIKNLLLDIAIHSNIQFLQNCLIEFVGQELDIFSVKKQQINNCRILNDSKDVLQCTNCKREIFLLFQFVADWVFHCIRCIQEERVTIYMKYNVNQLLCLIKSDTKTCSKQYCSEYVGKTQCEVQNKLLFSDSDQILDDLLLDCQEQSSSQANDIKNNDYESEIEKLQAKIQEIKDQHKRQVLQLRKYSTEESKMQEMFQDHANRAKKFYNAYLMAQFSKDKLEDLQALNYDWGFKRKISKKCAFTYEKLNIPIRSQACEKLKCVYEQDTITALLKNEKEKQNDYFVCVMCEKHIKQEDLFYDSELAKALKTNEICYFVRSIPITPINPQPFYIVDKNLSPIKQSLPELNSQYYALIENQSNQTLLNILALNIYKQRMETLQWLATNEDMRQFPHMQEYGFKELENEKSKYK